MAGEYPFKVDDPVFIYINGQKDRVSRVQSVNEMTGTIVVDGSKYEVNKAMDEAYLTSSEGYSSFNPGRKRPRRNYFKVTKASEEDIKDFERRNTFHERRDLYDHHI